ncbi:hypothetical protein BOSEA31B_10159 [Hyphomicrobiales bacterium]|nr:hypothetical protein BOSEA31B_10159 [Hyphomicrobiales bacterium]CAH1701838.1 hypothetical protein BOSEA1005_21537 [Hyphomicrobiales bacterium]CAI0345994.1 hypothetical protein BO1005MUT1_470152 [Hyphomicrobiales bacterium]
MVLITPRSSRQPCKGVLTSADALLAGDPRGLDETSVVAFVQASSFPDRGHPTMARRLGMKVHNARRALRCVFSF